MVRGVGFGQGSAGPFHLLAEPEKRRFTDSGLLEQLFNETVAIKQKLVTHHAPLDGTLVQANASQKSSVLIEGFLKPEDYKKRIRSLD